MPLITRRSSARSLPRTSVGRCGSISCHCSSLSQYKFDRIFSAPLTAENQQPILQATDLLGFSTLVTGPRYFDAGEDDPGLRLLLLLAARLLFAWRRGAGLGGAWLSLLLLRLRLLLGLRCRHLLGRYLFRR